MHSTNYYKRGCAVLLSVLIANMSGTHAIYSVLMHLCALYSPCTISMHSVI